MKNLNWDDLRIFSAVARARTAFDAAIKLEMNQSTVTRRVHRLEAYIGSKLFDRNSRGHQLTSTGLRLLDHVEKLERTMFEVEVSTFGDSTSLSGDIRIGTTEVFGSFFLAPHLAQFCAKHPAINIDLLPMPRNINLSKREADTSITLERPTLERFVTTKLLDYRMLPYATEAYLKKAAPIKTLDDLRKHNWFDYIDDLIFTDQQPSLQQWIPNAKSSFRSTSMTAQYQAVQAGLGIAILPCFLGAATAGFVPILSHEIDIKRTYWLTAASERRELARVRTLWDYLKKVAYANSNYLMGESCKMVWV